MKLFERTTIFKVLTIVMFMGIGAYFLTQSQAATSLIYMSPSSASKYVGDTFSVKVRVKATSNVNAGFIDMSYNANGLQVTSINRGADFPNQLNPTQHTISGGVGTIIMASTRNISGTGDLHYATVTFKAKAKGSFSFTILNSSDLVDYGGVVPFPSYLTSGGTYTFTNKPTPAPAPTPTPSPTPAPSTPSVNVPKTESKTSASNLKISDFKISKIDYRSATFTWKTNKPADSDIDYGYSVDSLTENVSSDAKVTSHKIVIGDDKLRAGYDYIVRISSSDGSGPVTLDGEFSTKSIGVVVKVTDMDNKPVSGAKVMTDKAETTTGEDGTVTMSVAEGNILFSAEKDNLSGDLTAEVYVPESKDSLPQQINLTVSPPSEAAEAPQSSESSTKPWALLSLIIGGIGLAALALFVRHRRSIARSHSPRVTIQTESNLPAPTYHETLPHMVTHDLNIKKKPEPPKEDEPYDMFSALDNPAPQVPPPMMPAKQDTTAQLPEPEPKPKAPVHHQEKPHKPKTHNAEKHHHKDAEFDPSDNSLHINHEDD